MNLTLSQIKNYFKNAKAFRTVLRIKKFYFTQRKVTNPEVFPPPKEDWAKHNSEKPSTIVA